MREGIKHDYEAEFEIRDKVVERLRSRTGEGKPLNTDRGPINFHASSTSSRNVEYDRVWIEDDETVQGEGRSMHDDFRIMRIRLVAEVRDKDPLAGPDKARKIALMVGSELTKDDTGNKESGPRLGLGYVYSVSFRRSVRDISLTDGVYSHIVEYDIGYRAAS